MSKRRSNPLLFWVVVNNLILCFAVMWPTPLIIYYSRTWKCFFRPVTEKPSAIMHHFLSNFLCITYVSRLEREISLDSPQRGASVSASTASPSRKFATNILGKEKTYHVPEVQNPDRSSATSCVCAEVLPARVLVQSYLLLIGADRHVCHTQPTDSQVHTKIPCMRWCLFK